MPSKYPKVSVIGAGSVGTALARALFEKGYPIISIVSKNGRSALLLAKVVKCKRASTVIDDIATESDIIIIATPDGAIPEIAKQLAKNKRLKFKKLFVAHTSGVHSADILTPLRKKGALTASVHPIQSFPHSKASRSSTVTRHGGLKGIFFGIEGDAKALDKAEQLVSNVGGKAIVIAAQFKPLYHAACVFASSYMMIFLNAISELALMLNLKASWTEVFGPLMTTAMENTVKYSATDALTGPIVRGDIATVEIHLEALSKFAPQLLPLYTIGGLEVARVTKEHGKIKQEEFDEILSRFKTFMKTHPVKHSKARH